MGKYINVCGNYMSFTTNKNGQICYNSQSQHEPILFALPVKGEADSDIPPFMEEVRHGTYLSESDIHLGPPHHLRRKFNRAVPDNDVYHAKCLVPPPNTTPEGLSTRAYFTEETGGNSLYRQFRYFHAHSDYFVYAITYYRKKSPRYSAVSSVRVVHTAIDNGVPYYHSIYVPFIFSESSLTYTAHSQNGELIGSPTFDAKKGVHTCEDFTDVIEYIGRAVEEERKLGRSFNEIHQKTTFVELQPSWVPDLGMSFLLMERGWPPAGRFTIAQSSIYRETLMQRAYKDALDNIPGGNTWGNGIQNILSCAEAVRNLKHGKVTIPSNWADAWLKYRYVLNTNLMDTEELFKRFTEDKIRDTWDMLRNGKKVRCYGTDQAEIADVHFKCICRLRVKPSIKSYFNNFMRDAHSMGLVPDLYLIWDSIPYSFIVDWFIPIGEALEAADRVRQSEEYYDISDVIFSFTYVQKWEDGTTIRNYSRFTHAPLSLNGAYWLAPTGASNKTTVKRIIDTAALLGGRK